MKLRERTVLNALPHLALYILETALKDGPCLKVDEHRSISLVTRNDIYHDPNDAIVTTNVPITENGFMMVVGERYLWPSYANRNLYTGSVTEFRWQYKGIDDLPKSHKSHAYINGTWQAYETIVPYQTIDEAIRAGDGMFYRHRPKVAVLIDPEKPGDKPRKQTYDHSYHFYKGIIY